jgi:hypothetical protein
MQPAVKKLLAYLKSKEIEFTPTDGKFNNVIFTSKDKEIKISHHSFYRFSGIACVYKEKGDHLIEAIEVTDEMFINNFMTPIIKLHFNLK